MRVVVSSRGQPQLVVVIFPCIQCLFELHVELVALQRHDKFVALDKVARRGMLQHELLVRVRNGRDSDRSDPDLS